MKTIIIIIIAIVVALVAWSIYQNYKNRSGSDDISINGEKYFLSTTTESQQRANSLLPDKGSEDVARLLISPDYSSYEVEQKNEYLPTEAVEWVITVNFKTAANIPVDELRNIFNKQWREQYGGLTLYGFDTESKKWSYVIAADGPKYVSNIKIAWNYYFSWDDSDNKLADKNKYKARLDAVKEAVKPYGEVELIASLSPEAAAKRTQELKTYHNELGEDSIIVLEAQDGQLYDGKLIWDVMLSLGLQWGDMDIFHWQFEEGFSVWTSTEPGYFFPELIAQDKVKTHDLVFGFPIARRYKPVHTFEQMLKAAEYAQKRLGGTIVDRYGHPIDKKKMREKIISLERRLTQAGFEPGSSPALMLF
jgi:cell division protein ZipA